ncbi:MAG: hypothetical protein AAF565_12880, partial [Pseudomonadota bacterium]
MTIQTKVRLRGAGGGGAGEFRAREPEGEVGAARVARRAAVGIAIGRQQPGVGLAERAGRQRAVLPRRADEHHRQPDREQRDANGDPAAADAEAPLRSASVIGAASAGGGAGRAGAALGRLAAHPRQVRPIVGHIVVPGVLQQSPHGCFRAQ